MPMDIPAKLFLFPDPHFFQQALEEVGDRGYDSTDGVLIEYHVLMLYVPSEAESFQEWIMQENIPCLVYSCVSA